jgi:DNA-binding response OmpR family regulator
MVAETSGADILVVDDDPLIRATLTAALSSRGYRATSTDDPHAVSAEVDPDAVVLDAILPKCSLSECLALLGHRSDGSRRPILVLSGSLTPPVDLAGTGIGYLSKPIPLSVFLDAVAELVASTSRAET